MVIVDPPAHRRITLDAQQVITLAHPLRSRLLTALHRHGPATATDLATRLSSNTGTTSYHLRKLAAAGLVADAPEHGDGRDRVWRAAQDEHSYSEQAFPDDPDATAASDWLSAHYLRTNARAAEDWVESRREWPAEWQSAATMSDFQLRLSPGELRAGDDPAARLPAARRAGLLHRNVDAAHRSTMLSVNSLGARLGGVLSGPLLGLVADGAGLPVVFVTAAVLLGAGAPLYLLCRTPALAGSIGAAH